MQNLSWQRIVGYILVFGIGGGAALWSYVGEPSWWVPLIAIASPIVGILLPRPAERTPNLR